MIHLFTHGFCLLAQEAEPYSWAADAGGQGSRGSLWGTAWPGLHLPQQMGNKEPEPGEGRGTGATRSSVAVPGPLDSACLWPLGLPCRCWATRRQALWTGNPGQLVAQSLKGLWVTPGCSLSAARSSPFISCSGWYTYSPPRRRLLSTLEPKSKDRFVATLTSSKKTRARVRASQVVLDRGETWLGQLRGSTGLRVYGIARDP